MDDNDVFYDADDSCWMNPASELHKSAARRMPTPIDAGWFSSRVSVPMHTERDIVTANPSVCPSVHHTPVLYRNECTYRQTLSSIW